MAKKSIESSVADALLERKREIEIGGVTYKVAPPSTETIILVSELNAELPEINEKAHHALESLRVAKDCRVIGEMVATMILGPDNLIEERTIRKKRLFGLVSTTETVTVDRRRELGAQLLRDLGPAKLYDKYTELLGGMETKSFFALITSLNDINILKPTKEVI